MTTIDRYLALVAWARRRYTSPDGLLTISRGGMPAAFSRLELAAARRYLKLQGEPS